MFLLDDLYFVDAPLLLSRFIVFLVEMDDFITCRLNVFSIFYFLRSMKVFGLLQILPNLLQVHEFPLMISFGVLPHLRQELYLSVVFVCSLLILLLLNLQQG